MKIFQGVPVGQDNSAETRFLVRFSRYIADTWPDSQEAQDSLSMLIGFMVNDGKIEEAESLLQQIPSSSPRRAGAELRTGQAIWRTYLQKMQAAKGEPLPNAEQLKQRAQGLLLEGINRARGEKASAATVQGALALAQIYIDVNSPGKAIELLNDPELGPLTLINKDDPVTKSGGFIEQAYKSALRAQIGALAQPGVDGTEMVQQAMETMNALSTAVGETADGKRRLTATYISLAKDLKRQLQLSTAETRPDIARAFESFLNQVAASSNDASALNWVAETYFSLAEGEQDVANGSPKVKEYYRRSAEVFRELLDKHARSTLVLDEPMVLQIQVRAATANLRAANFKQSFDLFEQVLARKNSMLNVQVDAAKAFQEAARLGQSDLYNKAIKGARPQGNKNVIWGWERIAKITAAQMGKSAELRARFANVFFESRYNTARCRYEQGLASAEEQNKLLTAAKRSITLTGKLYPDWGGEAWRRRFDRLMKEIQESLDEEPTGLTAPAPE